MRRSVGLAVAVLVAMTLGRLLTDHVPLASVSTRPFVRTGFVGATVPLRYADVRVDRVRSAASLQSPGAAVLAGGTFLIVDVTLVARHEPTTIGAVYLEDPARRSYVPTTRGGCTGATVQVPTGIPWHAMYCFDIPRRAVAGSRFVLSHGAPGSVGGQARDDLARIDLRIDSEDAARLGASKDGYGGFGGGFELPDLQVLPPPSEGGS